ncbi:hypothetical protein ACFLVQ_00955, partial [Chloroflexota bacterium]
KYCEDRGLGKRPYHVVGKDLLQNVSLASLNGRFGQVKDGTFNEILTPTMYHTPNKPLWDLQASCFAYMDINDRLTGSNFKQQALEAYDENGDGVIDYMERGRDDLPLANAYRSNSSTQDSGLFEVLKLRFLLATVQLKRLRPEWNTEGHHFGQEMLLGQSLAMALSMSNAPSEMPDPLFPEMTWGKGKWPSMQFAMHRQISALMYGKAFPDKFDMESPYGIALNYADAKWNGGAIVSAAGQGAIMEYHQLVARGKSPLPFTFYVPKGFVLINNTRIPNVEESDDPSLIFTASFNNEEFWQNLHLSEFNLR